MKSLFIIGKMQKYRKCPALACGAGGAGGPVICQERCKSWPFPELGTCGFLTLQLENKKKISLRDAAIQILQFFPFNFCSSMSYEGPWSEGFFGLFIFV